ncbi:MAG: PqiC family protein [Candidatus Adiutrix sp.]|jgi:cholesterol transport system auxiliary component|nr:PqiC family protein [Candidatus Adiutrix sp.]
MPKLSPIVFLALSLMLSCLGQPHPVKNRFLLAVSEEAPPAAAVNAAGRSTLLLGAVTAAPACDGRALVYRLGPDRYESDFYNEFLAPPTRLLAEVLADRLTRASQRLRVAVGPGLAVADFGLEAHIQELYGDFSQTPPRAVLTLRFTLNDLRPAAAKVISDRLYPCRRPWPEGTGAAGLVAAYGLCLNDILESLARDIDLAI